MCVCVLAYKTSGHMEHRIQLLKALQGIILAARQMHYTTLCLPLPSDYYILSYMKNDTTDPCLLIDVLQFQAAIEADKQGCTLYTYSSLYHVCCMKGVFMEPSK